jgi:hypothetical protein
MSVNAIADIIGETVTSYAIPRLLRMNGMDPDGISLHHTPSGDVDLEGLATFLEKMNPMLTWLPEDEAWLRDVGELPEVDIEVIRQAQEEEERRKREFEMAIRGNMGGKKEDDEDEGEQLTSLYAVDVAMDDVSRRRMERRWQRRLRQFFRAQRRRIEREVRKMRVPRSPLR